MRKTLVFGGIFGFLGVLLGAVGAHLLKDQLSAKDLGIFETAARYQIFHALALLAITGKKGRMFRAAAVLWIIGVFVFSGSLYLIVLTQVRMLGALAPVGGVALMAGWLCVVAGALRHRR